MASGMNRVEAAVMDLWDAGRSAEQIAEALGINRAWSRQIVSMMTAGSEDRDRAAATRASSDRYAAALAATGKVYR